jgi:hypothetical protein
MEEFYRSDGTAPLVERDTKPMTGPELAASLDAHDPEAA